MNTVKMRRGCNPKEGLKRGAWTSQEDKILSDYIKVHGLGRWRSLPANAGLNRCGKSCRLRWLNYLRPDIKRGNITEEEEELIIRLHKLLGNRWSLIAGRLPGRTDNEIKNYWNTYLRKKVRSKISEQQPSSRAKKASSTEKPSTEKKQISEVNVKRTKAVRCTRPLFTDQASDGHIPTPPSNSDFVSNLSANANKDENWIAEIMQNSLFSQVSRDSFYTSPGNNNLQTICGNGTSCFNEENYMRGLFSSCNREGEGLYYSFLDPDSSWESLVVTQKS